MCGGGYGREGGGEPKDPARLIIPDWKKRCHTTKGGGGGGGGEEKWAGHFLRGDTVSRRRI